MQKMPNEIRVMPLGDSITRGKGGSTWRHHLRNRLKKEGVLIRYVGSSPHAPNFAEPWSDHYLAIQQALEYNVAHEGWGGLKIHELISLKDHESYPDFTIETILSENPADLILLMIGTNDFKDKYETDTAWQRVKELIHNIIKHSDATLLVASILPMFTEYDPSVQNMIEEYNRRIIEIINTFQSNGSKIGFVDMHPHFLREDLLEDGIHPNLCGDRKIAELWSKAILSNLSNH